MAPPCEHSACAPREVGANVRQHLPQIGRPGTQSFVSGPLRRQNLRCKGRSHQQMKSATPCAQTGSGAAPPVAGQIFDRTHHGLNPYRRDLKQTFSSWLDHEGPRLAASLSLYSLLSLAPLVILTMAMASLAFGQSQAQHALLDEVRDVMGGEGARTVQMVIEHGKEPHAGSVASVIGIVVLIIGASSVF